MEIKDLIFKLNDGEQNRQGEIEYRYSLEERVRLLDQILQHPDLANLTGSSKTEFQSAIYWGLCGSIAQIEEFLIRLMPNYHVKIIEEAMLMHFASTHVLHHRMGMADDLLTTLEKLNLSHDAWKMEIRSHIESWIDETNDEHIRNKLHKMSGRFNR
jgi:hypothetical protein